MNGPLHTVDNETQTVQADREAEFFEKFGQPTWSPKDVNQTIQEAAKSTWRVKDIRDELRLLRQLFEKQLAVIEELAEGFWPVKIPAEGEMVDDARKSRRENFIRDTGLESFIQRVDHMDQDASTTLEGVS